MLTRPYPEHSSLEDRHPLLTRLSHMGLAISIIIQLLTSLIMRGPRHGRTPDAFFALHEIVGFVALGFAFLFWCNVMLRHRGTPLSLLFPWFSMRRIGAVWSDGLRHVGEIIRYRLPDYDGVSPLASAVHGLGLLLMTVMAVSGTIWFIGQLLGLPEGMALRLDIIIHHLFANLVWVYLIGHGLLALVHHVANQADIRRMWSLKND